MCVPTNSNISTFYAECYVCMTGIRHTIFIKYLILYSYSEMSGMIHRHIQRRILKIILLSINSSHFVTIIVRA